MTDLDATLRLLAERAPALRRAGVRSLKYGELEVVLVPDEPAAGPAPTRVTEDAMPSDPLDDPMAYPGGRVPSLLREIDRRKAERGQQVPVDEGDEHEDDDD